MLDVIVKNGTIIDGTGSPSFISDIGVKEGKIVAIEPGLSGNSKRIVDAAGKVVCPGFIDIHSHTDATILLNPKAESKIRQGVTTEIVGNCGMSAAPLSFTFLPQIRDHLTINGDFANADDIGQLWSTFGEYIHYLKSIPLGVNLMPLIGYGTLRTAVMGLNTGPPTPHQMEAMEDLLEECLQAGGCGMSTGLEYIPDAHARTRELIRLGRVLARHDKLYASHIRGESHTLFASLEEAIQTAEASGCQLEISHLKLGGIFNWGKTEKLFSLLEDALERGVRLSWDQYPYVAWGTGLADYLPGWVRQEGHQKLIEYLSNKASRKKIRQEMEDEIQRGRHAYNTAPWENVQISGVRSAAFKFVEGKRVAAIADTLKVDPFELVFDLLIAEKGSVSTLVFCMDEEDVKTIMRHPRTIIASDGRAVADYGALHTGSPHPRYYGAFPRVLGKYVRDEQEISLEMAIQKMTSMPAGIMGLNDRGLLASKMIADLVIFDANTISDMATFENPHQYAKGIEYVVIAGEIIVDRGTHSNRMAGKIIT
ncbi:MAG: D-aminoacylase [Desulfopila sp.]|jgi:N-acyl-D-amino-acid deacylase|nr:D-aminoacylase [Desulfopila sp.]